LKATNETQHRQEQQCQAVSVGSSRKFNSSSSNTKVEATASEKPQSATALQKPLDKRKAGQEVKRRIGAIKSARNPRPRATTAPPQAKPGALTATAMVATAQQDGQKQEQ